MTDCERAIARRRMLLSVPRSDTTGTNRLEAVSFCLLGLDADGLRVRFVDGRGRLLDLSLNPVVAEALRDCITLAKRLPPA